MPAKRIPQLDVLTGATSATDDKIVIFDVDDNDTKSITRQELGKGIVGDLPYTPSGGISATTVPAAIAELDTEAAKSAALAAAGGAALIGNTPAGTIAATTVQGAINEIVSDLAANSGSSLVGYIQGASNSVATTVQAKLRENVSVKDFGAVGDGVTDDTAAFALALAASRTVTIPAGTFVVNDLNVPSGRRIIGSGKQVTILTVSQNNSSVFLVNNDSGFNADCFYSDFTMTAKGGVTGAKGYVQTNKASFSAYIHFERIETRKELLVSYDGFFIFGVWDDCRDGYIGSPVAGQTHQAIRSTPASPSQGNQTNICKVQNSNFFRSDASTAAIELRLGALWTFENCDFENIDCAALLSYGVYAITFQNCWFEDVNSDYVFRFFTNGAPNPQRSRPTIFNGNHFNLQATSVALVQYGNSSLFRAELTNNQFSRAPSGFKLIDGVEAGLTNFVTISNNEISSGANPILSTYRQTITQANISTATLSSAELTTNIINSPQNKNQSVTPYTPQELSASLFTLLYTQVIVPTLTDVSSNIRLTGNAIQVTLGAGENIGYYQIPAKLAEFLRGKTVTLVISAYGIDATNNDGLTGRIYDSVTPTTSNAYAVQTGQINVANTTLQTAYVSYNIPSGSTSLYIAFRIGGANQTKKVNIEGLELFLGEIKPVLCGI